MEHTSCASSARYWTPERALLTGTAAIIVSVKSYAHKGPRGSDCRLSVAATIQRIKSCKLAILDFTVASTCISTPRAGVMLRSAIWIDALVQGWVVQTIKPT